MSTAKANRSSKSKTSSQTISASVLDTLARAGLITLGVAVGFVCLWVAACVVGAIASSGFGATVGGFFSALFG